MAITREDIQTQRAITEDLVFDLLEIGRWLSEEHKVSKVIGLHPSVSLAVELLGSSYSLSGHSPDYLHGVLATLRTFLLVDRKIVRIGPMVFLRTKRLSHDWSEPREFAALCARSVVYTVVTHFTGSAHESVSGLRRIMTAEVNRGLDGLIAEYDLNGDVGWFKEFRLPWNHGQCPASGPKE